MNFNLDYTKELTEINSTGHLYTHTSGLKAMYIKNSDENKVFSITFKTPADNNHGTPHVLEHCVLCGSKKYTVKDPFNELLKGSMYTFLNAMTFKDKTMYPVASCNEKDFYNLIDVYTDSVFFPLIKKKKEIFLQEGVNYKISEKEDLTGYGGIVYNEMKGVYSNPYSVSQYFIYKNLFNKSPYAFDTGGNPAFIPSLTYEQLINYHEKFYIPENCYVYIYGNVDGEKILNYIEENFLSKIHNLKQEHQLNTLFPTTPLAEPIFYEDFYVTAQQEHKNYISAGYVINEKATNKMLMALKLLDIYLLGMAPSPLRKAIIDHGFGKDIRTHIDTTIKTPVFIITAKDTNKTPKQFMDIIDSTLNCIVENGIDKKLIEACINKYEFILKEENFGHTPKGLVCNLSVMRNWLYNQQPFSSLENLSILNEIKNNVDYFNFVIEECFLKNKWRSYVLLKAQENKNNTCIENKNNTCIENILSDKKLMLEYQAKKDKKEDIEKIPILNIGEIDSKLEYYPINETKISGFNVYHCPLETNDIAYVDIMTDLRYLSQQTLSYVGLFAFLIGKLETKTFSLSELTSEIAGNLGSMNVFTEVFKKNGDDYMPCLVIRIKSLKKNVHKIFQLAIEISKNTLFQNEDDMEKLIKELFAQIENQLINEGHLVAMGRVSSMLFKSGTFMQHIAGLDFYNILKDLSINFKTNKNLVKQQLYSITKQLFTKNNTMFGVTCNDKLFHKVQDGINNFHSLIEDSTYALSKFDFKIHTKNEGISTSSLVNYVCQGFNLNQVGIKYSGKHIVLSNILDGDYLLDKVRIKGGAYGCYSVISRDGHLYFYSFRDPELKNTLDVYNDFIAFLEGYNPDDREMTKYILGTLNKYIRPKHVSQKGYFAITAHINAISHKQLLKEREDILSFRKEDIKILTEDMRNILKQQYYCVLGSKQDIEKNSHLFDSIIKC